jgi:hypothetical protein
MALPSQLDQRPLSPTARVRQSQGPRGLACRHVQTDRAFDTASVLGVAQTWL